jgi:cysteine desulfurase
MPCAMFSGRQHLAPSARDGDKHLSEKFVYFDNINTTFPEPEVIESLTAVLRSHAGNPSSNIHSAGIAAGEILDSAREKVASFINADPQSIIFTSGATESNNLAISGFLKAHPDYQLITSNIEHFSVINQAARLKREGHPVTILDVDQYGLIVLNKLDTLLQDGPALVSISLANPEIGTVQDIKSIGELCHKHKAVFHCDATAAAVFF